METLKNFKTEKGYFAGNFKKGRTTKLIDRNGVVVFTGMGICTKKDLYKTYISLQKK